MVAEQQLPVPLHWIGGGPMQTGEPAKAGEGELQLKESGSNFSISGPDGLLIEVSRSCLHSWVCSSWALRSLVTSLCYG